MNKLEPSQNPPHGLSFEEVPMFIGFGFDDNGDSGMKNMNNPYGFTWISKLFHSHRNAEGKRCSCSFYFTTKYIEEKEHDDPNMVKTAWRSAIDMGHEAGNHSHSHPSGREFSVKQWKKEILLCNEWLEKPVPHTIKGNDPLTGAGLYELNISGFRAPFLDYNNNTFTALQNCGFHYDCSIEEGWQKDQDGTNYFWPYTLDEGSPGHNCQNSENLPELENHPGLWEMPIHTVIVPPDEKCEQYGLKKGTRKKLSNIRDYFKESEGKITGLDWNMLVDFEMNKSEFLGTLKYTLDLRLQGNRAPMLFGAHSDIYSPNYEGCPNITWKERQEAIEEFLKYALLKKEVRITSLINILKWIKNPSPL